MSSKNNTEVIIDGKIFTLSGYESEEYLQKVANYINNKIGELKKEESYRRQNIDVQKALLDLNIADDYFKAKKQADALEGELEDKDKQLYDVKHELISLQIKLDACEKEKEELAEQLSEAQKEIIRLETRIAERKSNEAAEAPKTSRKSSTKSKSSSRTSKNRDNTSNSTAGSSFASTDDLKNNASNDNQSENNISENSSSFSNATDILHSSKKVGSSSDSVSYDSSYLNNSFSDSSFSDSSFSDNSFSDNSFSDNNGSEQNSSNDSNANSNDLFSTSDTSSMTGERFEQMGLFDVRDTKEESDTGSIANEVDKILSSLGDD